MSTLNNTAGALTNQFRSFEAAEKIMKGVEATVGNPGLISLNTFLPLNAMIYLGVKQCCSNKIILFEKDEYGTYGPTLAFLAFGILNSIHLIITLMFGSSIADNEEGWSPWMASFAILFTEFCLLVFGSMVGWMGWLIFNRHMVAEKVKKMFGKAREHGDEEAACEAIDLIDMDGMAAEE